MPQATGFGIYIKGKREAAGLSQRDIANELGYDTAQFISNWERGISSPPIKTLKQLSLMFKTPADEIFEHLVASETTKLVRSMRNEFAAVMKPVQMSFKSMGSRRNLHA